jgi:hypothetical protein
MYGADDEQIPTAGSFPHFATRFIDPAVGFSLAISYGYCYTISIAAEASASAILVSYWTDMTPAVVISISLVLILGINLLSVRWFGESEVVAGTIKVACFLGLVIVSIVITSGGGPNGQTTGFRYWHNPGAWVDYNGITGSTGHFLGFLAAFINASFSFIGVEVVVITAAESVNPHKAIPRSATNVTYRIALFYILGALLIGLIVDPTNPDLVSGTGNAKSSPWVIAIKEAGISVRGKLVLLGRITHDRGNDHRSPAAAILRSHMEERRPVRRGRHRLALWAPRISESRVRWRIASIHLAGESEHCRWTDCLGNAVFLLHTLPCSDEGSERQSRHLAVEEPFPAFHGMVWIYWRHDHYPRSWIPCISERQLEHCKLHCIVHRHSYLHHTYHHLEAGEEDEGKSHCNTKPELC